MKTKNNTQNIIPERKDIPARDCWDLKKLYPDNTAWEKDLKILEGLIPDAEKFKGALGDSPAGLKACLQFNVKVGMLEERLGYYAHLKFSEDMANSVAKDMLERFTAISVKFQAASSYQTPEIQAIPDEKMSDFLESDELTEFKISLKKLLRYKPHILSEQEERLLAMQEEFSGTAKKSFGALTDVDMIFGEVETPEGKKPLTQSTFMTFMLSPDRELRKKAYGMFMDEFDAHKNTLSTLYNGSVQLDVFKARIRKFPSAIQRSLFSDNVPVSVYNNLIDAVHQNLPALHRYYGLRKKILGLNELHIYDTRVPLVPDISTHYPYEQACGLVVDSLTPLGDEYCGTLRNGLKNGWVDRYENKGKRSGAFSAGSYVGEPYILINYKEDILNEVFTLAHEAGHSMHSWYSVKDNTFQDYNYSIFVAEVASTFNEQLLFHHLMKQNDKSLKAFLINKQVDDIIGTIYRQTMFAEYEKNVHEMAEAGKGLTLDSLTEEYQKLLEIYFGDEVILDKRSNLEGLRIPHFYSAFYVYKYATGISAAMALSQRVLNGSGADLEDFLNFLKSGGRKFPLEQLKDAGVDMTTKTPVNTALSGFNALVDELSGLIE